VSIGGKGSRRRFTDRLMAAVDVRVGTGATGSLAAQIAALGAAGSVAGTDYFVTLNASSQARKATAAQILAYIAANASGTWGISITGSAPAGSLTGTTLAANVVTSSLTTIGTLVAGAVPASLVTAGTFGTGSYIINGGLTVSPSTVTPALNVNASRATANGSLTGGSFTVSNSPTSGTAGSTIAYSGTAIFNGPGAGTDLMGGQFAISRTGGTVTNGYGVKVSDITSTVTNAYGVYVGAVTGGGTLNYAIYTNAGLVRFGGATTIASGGLTVSASGAAITGDSSVAGRLSILGTHTDSGAGVVGHLYWNGTATSAEGTGIVMFGAAGTFEASGNNESMYGFRCDNWTFDPNAFTGTIAYGIYLGVSGAATNYAAYFTSGMVYSAGTVGFGTTPSSTTRLIVAAGTTGISSLRVPDGVAPSSPVDGDVWNDGTQLRFREAAANQYASWTEQASIADASGGTVIDSEARTALNDLLAKLRTINVIAA
jgi:hypothetical protein